MSKPLLELPASFERVLLRYLKTHYLRQGGRGDDWNRKDVNYFAKGIVDLNKNFTQNRAGKYRDYFSSPVMRSGYLAYFLPVNAVKCMGLMERHWGQASFGKTIRIADVGAGPLTLSFGFLFFLMKKLQGSKKLTTLVVDGYELNKKMLSDGMALMHDFIKEAGLEKQIQLKVNCRVGNFFKTRVKSGHYDLVLLGNFLNEFDGRDDQWQLVSKSLRFLSVKGTRILFLEPGSKKFSRDLQLIRDRLITDMAFKILGPCLHHHGCPLNITAKGDWCNFSQNWKAPQFIQDFDALTSLKKSHLIYSYLFVEQGEPNQEKQSTQKFVAISDVMKQKGRLELIGCGEAGRIRFVRSNADRSDHNDNFGYLRRGQLFEASTYKHEGPHVLNKNVSVKKDDCFEVLK